MLDEKKNGGDGEKAELEKRKKRNGKIKNAEFRENAEVSHACYSDFVLWTW